MPSISKRRAETMKRQTLFFAFSLWLAVCRGVYADSSSANYKVDSDFVSAGGEKTVNGTSYKVEESSLDNFSKDTATSANYKAEGRIAPSALQAVPPDLNSITPGNFAKFFTDESASFTVSASSPEGASLQYKGREGATTKTGPQTSNLLSWLLSVSDKGRHTYNFDVIDSDATTTKPQAAYIYRRPVK